MLDAVLKVIPADTTKDALADRADPASPETPDDKKTEDGKDDKPPEDGDEDDKLSAIEAKDALVAKKFNKILTQRAELRKQVREFTAELEAIRPKAEIAHQIETFAQQNDLSGDDVANVLQIAAFARKGDYESFYKAVAPIFRKSQEYMGHALPREIRERVAKGEMTEVAAKEFVRLSMDHQRAQLQHTAEQQIAQTRTVQLTQDQVMRSVTAYEEKLAAADPDYKVLAPAVKRVAQGILLEKGNRIDSVEDALKITKAAYDEVSATYRKMQPRPHATTRQPNGNGQSRAARPEPTNSYEAALVGLERARNGSGYT